MTASGHEIDSGNREQENAYADDVTGSGQKTANSHAESGPGETGIDPRISTGLPENESIRVESGRGQKTATNPDTTAHGKRVIATMTASNALDLLTANGKRSESENDGHGHKNYLTVHKLLSFRAPRSEDREPRDDDTQERSSEVTPNSPRR